MSEQLANLDYMAISKETTKGTVAAVPSVFVPLYSQDFGTRLNLQTDNPIVGNKWKRYQTVQGQRGHAGSFVVMAEPNTAGHFFNMLLTKGTTTGSGPYTHPFTVSVTDPKSYTVDIKKGRHVHRYLGVEASSITPEWEDNEMRFNVSASGLKSWEGREISTVTGAGPYTITFTTTYDPSPTTGLIVGDLIQVYDVSLDTYIDAIVDTIENGTQITVSENVSAGTAGDFVTLRASTPSYTILTPFLWSRTEFCFADTAANALSATHTPLEVDSGWNIMHDFEDEEGAKRSGSFDPASLPRLQVDAEFTARKFFDTPLDQKQYNAIAKNACVIRHYSGSGYELRITLNDLRASEGVSPELETATIDYSEITYLPNYSGSDSQAIDVKVINALSTH